MLELRNLTKHYRDVVAVDDLTFDIRPGIVTGFLGPNGAGKSTTMRLILGLDRPTAGSVAIDGHDYRSSSAPLHDVGALLDGKAVDKGRSARNHLLALGATVGVGARRVDELLDTVGLTEVAHKSAGSFSLGMGQRLGIATALLADPSILILDEPVNGLDPDGILWVRTFLRELAAEGRTVFLSSHLMSEMEVTADHLVVVGRGRLIRDVSMAEFIAAAWNDRVRVVSPAATTLAGLVAGPGVSVTSSAPDELTIEGVPAADIGNLAARHGLALHELIPLHPSLEEAYMELTKDSVQYHGRSHDPLLSTAAAA